MKFYKGIATAFGSGYFPVAPGTAGSIVGSIFLFCLNAVLVSCNVGTIPVLLINALAILFITFLGVYAINKVHQVWAHDDNKIVIDEVIGVWIASFALPTKWYYYLLALILFRLYDIFKPLGIRALDKMQSDWSVMLDDVLAGVYAFITFWAGLFIYTHFIYLCR
jgi:phosphatidylglycerophosphatase A